MKLGWFFRTSKSSALDRVGIVWREYSFPGWMMVFANRRQLMGSAVSFLFQMGLLPARKMMLLHMGMNAMSLYEMTGTSLTDMVYETFASFAMNGFALSLVTVLLSL